MSRQLCDPNVEKRWLTVDADDDVDAVKNYLADLGLDPGDCAEESFVVLVRDDPKDRPREVRVEVVRAHFKVRP